MCSIEFARLEIAKYQTLAVDVFLNRLLVDLELTMPAKN